MHVLIDIGNSTIVVAIADQQGDITNTWRFKTRKEETVTFFRYELKQGLRKYNLEPADI
jgi:type III pantothenate kinase